MQLQAGRGPVHNCPVLAKPIFIAAAAASKKKKKKQGHLYIID